MARRVCIVTGGGDAPGINAVLRAFVHASSPDIDVFGARFGFEGLMDDETIVPLPIAAVRGILPKGGSILGCSTRVYPFFVPVPGGSATHDLGPDIVARLQRLEMEGLVLIGGDGTMAAAKRFMDAGLPCVGIPKTIDNDMGGTDQTFGFDTALDTATRAVDALHSTAESHRRVMILEVMGRYAGFIALESGVAGGADVVLLPEIPYDIARIVEKIEERERLGLRFTIVVVAEGAAPKGGVVAEIEGGRPGHLPRLGGAGARLALESERACPSAEVRVTVLGHLQRGGSPSAFDRALGSRFGAAAARLVRTGEWGKMVSLRGTRIESIPIEAALLEKKVLDPQGEYATAARLLGITLGD
ncbi:MAG: ATP-dependent 6-phosphofructokinase [Myxococcales bacterium]|nr:ATP-dependent 6-phosphofructokinase [Myxococcales bacterium]